MKFTTYLKESKLNESFSADFFKDNLGRTGEPVLEDGVEIDNSLVLDNDCDYIATLAKGGRYVILTNTDSGEEFKIPRQCVKVLSKFK